MIFEFPTAIMRDKTERTSIARQRDRIVFGKSPDYGSGGIAGFYGLEGRICQELLDLGLADAEEIDEDEGWLNFGQITEFLLTFPELAAYGYAVSPDRDDCRITLYGVIGNNVTRKGLAAFRRNFPYWDATKATLAYCRSGSDDH